MMRYHYIYCLFLAGLWALPVVGAAVKEKPMRVTLAPNGDIQHWLVLERIALGEDIKDQAKAEAMIARDLLAKAGGEAKLRGMAGETVRFPGLPAKPQAWTPVKGVDYYDFLRDADQGGEIVENSANYAYCVLESDREQQALLQLGADDGIKVYFNGALLLTHALARSVRLGDDEVTLPLRKGENALLIRVDNMAFGTGLCARLLDPATKQPMTGVQVVLPGAEGMRLADKATMVPRPNLPKLSPTPYDAFFGARVQRTMSLIAGSTVDYHPPVKILIYGQSITAGEFWKDIVADLRSRYPYANLIVENRSIGGYTAPALARTAQADLYPFYPTLVIFQDYEGHYTGELERMIANVRRFTTAEILIWTAHCRVDKSPEQTGNKSDDDHSRIVRLLAQKYNCELVEVREEWQQYLRENNFDPQYLLQDGIHPNARGRWLLYALINRHLRFNPLFPSEWMQTVRTYEAKRLPSEGLADEVTFTGAPWRLSYDCVIGESSDSALRLTFTGNRVDVIAAPFKGKVGTATIRIDGKAPSSFPELYVATRTTLGHKWGRPAINRVTIGSNAIPEEWTLTLTSISLDGRKYTYDVAGSVTGPDGSGSNEQTFVSNSGRITLLPNDFTFATALSQRAPLAPVGFKIVWQVTPNFVDTWTPATGTRPAITTLAQGLSNGEHTLEIIPNGDGPVPVGFIETHCPPLK